MAAFQIEFGRATQATVWTDSLPDLDLPPSRTERFERAVPRVTPSREAGGAIEVRQHVGGMTRYGLLGGAWSPGDTRVASVSIAVVIEKQAVDISVALDTTVYPGMDPNYVDAAAEGALSLLAERSLPGTLEVTHAAHCLVGSSPAFFQWLGYALPAVLIAEHKDADAIRDVLTDSLSRL